MSDEGLIEKKVSSRKVFSGKLLHVNVDEVLLPNNKKAVREYIIHPGAAVIIPVLENGDIVMLRQFRYPVNQVLYELPAGKIDSKEDPLECAKRELFEETGYTCKDMTFLSSFYPCIGYSDEEILIYLAKGLTLHEGNHSDDDEFLEVMSISLEKALEFIKQGKITDAKTIISLFWAEKTLCKIWK